MTDTSTGDSGALSNARLDQFTSEVNQLRVTGGAANPERQGAMWGAGLMGVGGVLALGCTVGNGLTGIASLAPTSFIALPAMVLAAAATMKWRWRKQS